MSRLHVVCTFLLAVACGVSAVLPALSSPTAPQNSSTAPIQNVINSTDSGLTIQSRVSSILKDLPKLKNIVIFVCGFTVFLIACLVIKVFRAGRKIRKTRKYDIITTPAERVEMAPLNEENDEDEDSTLFDVKYR
ncbi:membrane protein FAM174B [Lepisosteus oculatus]|uniref:membrane protein FAM174B n=1 Tax=Lepisosteus oculatus TaxID=7918 RepID=UPI0003EA85D8|nr:PREDICTED: membrane protein FAM174B [Lepisosteus oculatus]